MDGEKGLFVECPGGENSGFGQLVDNEFDEADLPRVEASFEKEVGKASFDSFTINPDTATDKVGNARRLIPFQEVFEEFIALGFGERDEHFLEFSNILGGERLSFAEFLNIKAVEVIPLRISKERNDFFK